MLSPIRKSRSSAGNTKAGDCILTELSGSVRFALERLGFLLPVLEELLDDLAIFDDSSFFVWGEDIDSPANPRSQSFRGLCNPISKVC